MTEDKKPQTPDSSYSRDGKRKMPMTDKIWLGLMAVGAWGVILALLFGSGWR